VVKPGPRRDAVAAAVAFVAFGGSDVVESFTGAWWRPWWLFAWKAACVLGLLVLLARRRRRQARGRECRSKNAECRMKRAATLFHSTFDISTSAFPLPPSPTP